MSLARSDPAGRERALGGARTVLVARERRTGCRVDRRHPNQPGRPLAASPAGFILPTHRQFRCIIGIGRHLDGGSHVGTNTGIEWTDATWNPMTGCTRISAGCDHCYAALIAQTRLLGLRAAVPRAGGPLRRPDHRAHGAAHDGRDPGARRPAIERGHRHQPRRGQGGERPGQAPRRADRAGGRGAGLPRSAAGAA
ncbi:MAG TPA: DUF5131 family protein, partial [Gemmatimonadaceae bacterium]|nr:DUF5131 family protein [Gemmatimonadaceae bacterium]